MAMPALKHVASKLTNVFVKNLAVLGTIEKATFAKKRVPVLKNRMVDADLRQLSRLKVINSSGSIKLLTNGYPQFQMWNGEQRPLLVMMAWLTAQEKHLNKYREIYLARGFDVLTVQVEMQKAVWPITGSQVAARELLDYLNSSSYKDILVHMFSMGAYQFAESMVIMNQQKEKYSHLTDRFKGLIYDSCIDYYNVPNGLPRVLVKNPLAIKLLQWATKLYMLVFYKWVTRHYIRASKQIRYTFFRCPVLMFASEDDALDNFGANIRTAELWRSMGIDVQWRSWEKSEHVQHFCNYPDEYIAEVDKYLAKINVGHLGNTPTKRPILNGMKCLNGDAGIAHVAQS